MRHKPATEVTSLLSDSSYIVGIPQNEQGDGGGAKDYKSPTENTHKTPDNEDRPPPKWRFVKALAQLAVLFSVSLGIAYLILKFNIPPLEPGQRDLLRLPRNLEDLRALNKLLGSYMDKHYYNVMTSYVTVYIFLQTFSIPGSMWLSILGGALFGMKVALIVVCTCCAVGASFCYLLSRKYLRSFVRERFADRLDELALTMKPHAHNLLNYLIVLRIAPFPPNWFANLAAPHVGIPLKIFTIGTFLGVAGPSLIHVQAGATINNLSGEEELQIFTVQNVGALCLIALGAMIPVFLRRRIEQSAEQLEEV